jgi:hypothetical protein
MDSSYEKYFYNIFSKRMTHLVINPSIITIENKMQSAIGYRTYTKKILVDFAYVLSNSTEIIEHCGFAIKNSVSKSEMDKINKISGISSGIVSTSGKTMHECIIILIDILKRTRSKIIIVNYKAFYDIIAEYSYMTRDSLCTIVMNELNKRDIVDFDDTKLEKKTNIAISDCLSIAKTISIDI